MVGTREGPTRLAPGPGLRPRPSMASVGLLLGLGACGSSHGRPEVPGDALALATDRPDQETTPGACSSAGAAAQWAVWPMPDPTTMNGPRSQRYDTASAETALDRITGLTWQRAMASQILDWPAARSYCECLTLGGHDDWRLPSRIELVSIVDFTRHDPAIDATTFPGTPNEWFWTASLLASSDTPAAWYLGFFDGDTHHAGTEVLYHARCVRGERAPPQLRRAIPGDGTVVDAPTGLTWQREVEAAMRTWTEARSYCAGLTLARGGWRLPDMKELQTLIDESRVDPPIDQTAFPATPPGGFWAAPQLADMPAFAWFVNFSSGIAYNSPVDHPYSVRCVR
jgi:hypothetical protein